MCPCGHELLHHDKKGCSFGRGTKFGGCACKKPRERGEKPTLARPDGAVDLMRPDTVRPKKLGWAVIASDRVEIFLDNVKTKSPNVFNRWARGGDAAAAKGLARRIMIGEAIAHRKRVELAMSAVEQCKVQDRGRPSRVTIVRLSTGKLDDDNLAAACKAIRDGIAEGLLFDDREFSIAGQDPAKVALFYAQRAPGKRGVHGIVIELQFTN